MSLLFPTTQVGSYPQPEWLIDRSKLLLFAITPDCMTRAGTCMTDCATHPLLSSPDPAAVAGVIRQGR
ncbi:MAG: hypothetical protein OEV81_15025, partial [Betaproteobacteria bacterium]|nr:hypothetical protein [Betaproteobacteria bacterium]